MGGWGAEPVLSALASSVRQEFRECAADLRFQTCFKKLGRLDAIFIDRIDSFMSIQVVSASHES